METYRKKTLKGGKPTEKKAKGWKPTEKKRQKSTWLKWINNEGETPRKIKGPQYWKTWHRTLCEHVPTVMSSDDQRVIVTDPENWPGRNIGECFNWCPNLGELQNIIEGKSEPQNWVKQMNKKNIYNHKPQKDRKEPSEPFVA